MSQRIGNVSIIEPEPDMICFECGAIGETRPYGPKGADICFACGEKMPEIRDHNMKIRLFGEAGELK